LTPNDHYSGRTAPLTSKRCNLYIYSTNTVTEYFKRGIYCPFFFSSKCSLFHNSNVFGSCFIQILYTGCDNILKNNSGSKRLILLFKHVNKIFNQNHLFRSIQFIVHFAFCDSNFSTYPQFAARVYGIWNLFRSPLLCWRVPLLNIYRFFQILLTTKYIRYKYTWHYDVHLLLGVFFDMIFIWRNRR